MSDPIEVLQNCSVNDHTVKLPAVTLERKVYLDVKKKLEGIGGKWKGGKVSGFVFPHCPKDMLAQIIAGQDINLKKDFQFFETPADLAEKMVRMADLEPKHLILEPEAGKGAIISAIKKKIPGKPVYCFELMATNRDYLRTYFPDARLLGDDFLLFSPNALQVDRIIANPPFTKNQDIDHVYHMYKSLAHGGRIVTVMSTHAFLSSNKKETQFRDWLKSKDAEITALPPGTFKESGTMVASCLVVINKKEVDHG